MKKIAIISPNFTEERFCERWIQFAKAYPDYEVYLFIPDKRKVGYQKEYSFGKIRKDLGRQFENGNCRGLVFSMKYHRFISWTSSDLIDKIRGISPDLIYYIGLHNQESIVQLIQGRNRYLKGTKIILFSMRGPQHCLRKPTELNVIKAVVKQMLFFYEKRKQKFIYTNCDAMCCHYPEAKELFSGEGFQNAIYVQTQIGVNATVYKKNDSYRKEIRQKYKIEERHFVFGSAIRFAKEKGIEVILKALKGVDAKLLLMGSGSPSEENNVAKLIREYGLEDKVIKTGFVVGDEMAKYWNAVDCAIHVPITTKNWIETFSLAVVQAMAVGVPIIGSSSGSVPYQVGLDELIVPENDSKALEEKMNWIMLNPNMANNLAREAQERTFRKFEIQVLNSQMYTICEEVLNEGR